MRGKEFLVDSSPDNGEETRPWVPGSAVAAYSVLPPAQNIEQVSMETPFPGILPLFVLLIYIVTIRGKR